jgi:hypothetical protein
MAAVRFDTLGYARKLERAGVPAEQAALQATALNDALAETGDRREQLLRLEMRVDRGFADVDARFDQIVGRSDARFGQVDARFDHVETKLSARIDALDLKLSGKISTLQWMFGTMVALVAAIFIQSLFRP